MSFKFIHMADLHIDTPFASRDAELRETLRDSIRESFKACVDLALSEEVHALLIAGDLFDSENVSFSSKKFLQEQMSRLNGAGVSVLYAPGNHDPYNSRLMKELKWPDNVHVFKNTVPESINVYDRDGNIVGVVIGAGHESSRECRNLSLMFPNAKGSVPCVGLLHAYVSGTRCNTGDESYAPCSLSDLSEKGYSYWALGHIHKREELCDNPYIVYPGNPSGRDPGETGQKGAYIAEIKSKDFVEVKFIPTSHVYWENIYIDSLSEIQSILELEKVICGMIIKNTQKVKISECSPLYRIVLEGPSPLYNSLDDDEIIEVTQSIKSDLDIKHLEIIAGSLTRMVNIDEYKNQPHVLGTALSIIDTLSFDDELLLKLAPKEIAGNRGGGSIEEKLKYLRSLLSDIDYETAACLVKEDYHED